MVLAPDTQSWAGLADQVMAYVAERVAPYQKVRELHVIDALPVTPTGSQFAMREPLDFYVKTSAAFSRRRPRRFDR